MIHLFLHLLLAHLFADFPLQTDALARYKKRHLLGVLLHVMIYTFVTAILIADRFHYWPLILGLGVAHFTIDASKRRLYRCHSESVAFVLDQILHLLSMIVAVILAQWWWPQTPMGLVPTEWLPYALFAASLPALIVAYWIWASSAGRQFTGRYQWLNHFYRRALIIEQRFGLAIMCLTFWLLVRQNL